MNYFELFQLPPEFQVNLEELKQRYQQLLKRTHPDRYAGAAAAMQQAATKHAAELNTAYQVLQDPVQRAIHLLALQGVTVDLQASLVDPEFLEVLWQIREQCSDDPVAAEQLLRQQQARYLAELTAQFSLPVLPVAEAVLTIKKLYGLNKI